MNFISVVIFISLIVVTVGGANLFLYNMLKSAYGEEVKNIFLILIILFSALSVISMRDCEKVCV